MNRGTWETMEVSSLGTGVPRSALDQKTATRHRIAFVDYVLDPAKPGRSGLSDIVWDLGDALARRGHDIHIVGSYRTTTYPSSRVAVHNFPCPPTGYRNVVGNALLLARAARIVRAVHPDLVHAPEYFTTWLFSHYRVPFPMVLTVPGNIFYRLERGSETGFEWYYAQILKWAARRSARECAAVVATSREMREWWMRTGSRGGDTPVIPLGTDPERFCYRPGARRRLGLPESLTLFLYAGRLSPEKGVDTLIDAVDLAREDLVGHGKVIIVGRGLKRVTVKMTAQRLGLGAMVEFRDWVNQETLSDWYSAADALVMPSRAEPFGRTMTQAMMCGTPVIASDLGGARDLIVPGTNGYLLEADDPYTLARLLGRMASERERLRWMRKATEERARSELTWDQVAIQMEAVYARVRRRTEGAVSAVAANVPK